jgi:hypothetical protein
MHNYLRGATPSPLVSQRLNRFAKFSWSVSLSYCVAHGSIGMVLWAFQLRVDTAFVGFLLAMSCCLVILSGLGGCQIRLLRRQRWWVCCTIASLVSLAFLAGMLQMLCWTILVPLLFFAIWLTVIDAFNVSSYSERASYLVRRRQRRVIHVNCLMFLLLGLTYFWYPSLRGQHLKGVDATVGVYLVGLIGCLILVLGRLLPYAVIVFLPQSPKRKPSALPPKPDPPAMRVP